MWPRFEAVTKRSEEIKKRLTAPNREKNAPPVRASGVSPKVFFEKLGGLCCQEKIGDSILHFPSGRRLNLSEQEAHESIRVAHRARKLHSFFAQTALRQLYTPENSLGSDSHRLTLIPKNSSFLEIPKRYRGTLSNRASEG